MIYVTHRKWSYEKERVERVFDKSIYFILEIEHCKFKFSIRDMVLQYLLTVDLVSALMMA